MHLLSPKYYVHCFHHQVFSDSSLLLSPILGPLIYNQKQCPFQQKMVWSNEHDTIPTENG